MPANDKINLQVGYTVDQQSLNKVKSSLQDLQKIKLADFSGTDKELKEIQKTAKLVEIALTNAFNVNLNSLNISKFNQSLKGLSINDIYTQFSKLGAQGEAAFSQVARSVLTTNMQLKLAHSLVSQMGETMANTVKWGIASSVMNSFTSSVQQAFQYVKGLDSALTDIRIVTGDSTEKMQEFAVQANRAAQALGRSTMDYSKAALTFYQQGLDEQSVQARTQATLQAQNITGAGDEMADYLTAVWNGYKVANEEAELYVDKLAAVADSSASNMSLLAVAMSRVASTANTMGVDVDQLNAQIATIVATTRQAPESVGNALKTIYTRINDISTGADGAEVSLGNYSKQMAAVGINVLDTNGKLRDTGLVIEEIGGKWASMSRLQQLYLARTMAGQRQINNMTALFDNWSRYSDLVNVSMLSQGALVEKNSIYMESLGAKMEQLGAAGERVKDALINEEDLKGIVELGTGLTNLLANFIESIGGGKSALLAFGSIATQVFSGTIAKEINAAITNHQIYKNNLNLIIEAEKKLAEEGDNYNKGISQEYVNDLKALQGVWKGLSDAEKQAQQNRANDMQSLRLQQHILQLNTDQAKEFYAAVTGKDIQTQSQDVIEIRLKKVKQSLSELQNAYEDVLDINIPQSSMEIISSEQILKSKENLSSLASKVREVISITTNEDPDNNPLVKILDNIASEGTVNEEVLDNLLGKVEQLMNKTSQGIINSENFSTNLSEYQKLDLQFQTLRKDFEDVNKAGLQALNIENAVKFVGAIGQVASGINNIVNLFKVWQNDSLSAGEKILQTFSNLAFTVPMLVNAFKSINTFIVGENILSQKSLLLLMLKTKLKERQLALQEAMNGNKAAEIALDYIDEDIEKLKSGLSDLPGFFESLQAKAAEAFSRITGFISAHAIAIGGITAAAAAIYVVYRAWTADARAAKEAAEAAQLAKKSYDSVKESVNDLKTSLDDYNSAVDNLKDLTKGTLLWADALTLVNDKVLDLLEKFPELAKYISTTSDGMIRISKEGQDYILNLYAQRANISALNYVDARRNSDQASAQNSITDFYRDNLMFTFGDVAGITDDLFLRAIEAIQEHGNSLLGNSLLLAIVANLTKDQAERITKLAPEINSLITLINANTSATDALSDAYLNQAIDQDKYTGPELYRGLYNNLAKNYINNYKDEAVEGLEKIGEDSAVALANYYNTLVGLNEQLKVGFNSVTDPETEKKLTAEDIKTKIENTLAIKGLTNEYNNFNQQVQLAINALLNGNLSKSNSDAVKNLLNTGNLMDFSQLELENLIFNQDLANFANENYLALGYDSGKDFQDAFIKAREDALSELLLIGKRSLQTVQKALLGNKDFSVAIRKNLETSFDQAFKQAGKVGLDSLNTIINNADEDVVKQVSEIFANADISTPEGLKQLEQDLGNIANGEILATDEWHNFKQAVEESQFTNPLDSIFERQGNVDKIAGDIKKYSVISEEDYNILLDYNSLIDTMFTRTAEGYEFIGQKGTLIEALMGNTNGYIEAANQLDDLQDKAKEIANTYNLRELKNTTAGVVETNVFSDISGQIGDDSKIWAQLGTKKEVLEDNIELVDTLSKQRYLTEDQKVQLEEAQNYLQEFYSNVQNLDLKIAGDSDSLRAAAALSATSLSLLVGMFANGEISSLHFANALQKVSDVEVLSYGIDVDQYEAYVRLLMDTLDAYKDNEVAARAYATEVMRINEGIDSLTNDWDDFNAAIEGFRASGGDIGELVDVWDDLSTAISNTLNIDKDAVDMLGPDFVEKNWDKIEAVKNGAEHAYEDLQDLILGQVLQIAIDDQKLNEDIEYAKYNIEDAFNYINDMALNAPEFTVWADTSQLDAATGDVEALRQAAEAAGSDVEASSLKMMAAFQEIADGAGWSSALAQAAFSAMGYDVEVEAKDPLTRKTSTETQYYVPPTYEMETIGISSLGFSGLSLPVTVAKMKYGGRYESVGGTAGDYEPGTYAIKSITKNGKSTGGNISRKRVANNAARSAPKSSGSKGRSSSPKSSSTKQPTQVKPVESSVKKSEVKPDFNPYEQVDKLYERQSDVIDDLQKKLKKLVNKDRLKNLQAQNKELEKQADIIQLKLDISNNKAVENTAAWFADQIQNSFDNVKFDSDGQISDRNALEKQAADNYNARADALIAALKKALDEYNSWLINVYNKASAALQENLKNEKERRLNSYKEIERQTKERLDTLKKEYDERLKLLDSYDKEWQMQQKLKELLEDIKDLMYDIRIAASKIKVDLSIEAGDFERDWLDFEKKFIKKVSPDDFLGNAKASVKELMSYFNTGQIQSTANQIKTINNEIAIMSRGGVSEIYGTNMAQAKADLEEYMKQHMEDLLAIQDKVDLIRLDYLDALDDAKDKMDKQIDQYERVNDLINHNVKLTQLLYGDKAYDTMNKYYDLQKANNEKELDSLRQQQLYWQNLLNNELVGSDSYKIIQKNLDDVTDKLNSKLEEMIQNLSDQWLNRVNGIIDKLNNAMTGGRGLDYLDEQWDYINNYDDLFLDPVESRMGIQEVQSLYQLAIDGLTGSPRQQEKINKLMEDQLKLLREKDHLTEYDIERAKASLEVEKARLALEEQRDSKTRMRLRRDSQGNYTYQYVADEEKLGDLQSALADAQANLYNTDKLHYKQNLNNLYDAYKDYIEKMRLLTAAYNATQDEEERKRIQARIDLLKESTAKLMLGFTEDNAYLLGTYLPQSTLMNMNLDPSQFNADEMLEIVTTTVPQATSNIQDLAKAIVKEGGILPATKDMIDQIAEATKEYDKNVQSVLTTAGTSTETIANVIDEEGNALDKNIQNAQSLITSNQELIKSCLAQVNAMQEMLSYVDKLIENALNVNQIISNLRTAYNTNQALNGYSNVIADNIPVTDFITDTTTGTNYTGNPKTDMASIKQQINQLMAQYEKFLEDMTIATFDTGGSTGTWGDAEGRLAFLHQKELVLNETDTMNILKAVEAVRMITGSLGNIADSLIGGIIQAAGGLLGSLNTKEQLEQDVHIEANFPNVTQHTEIEQAFNNLVNMASMRASRYRD